MSVSHLEHGVAWPEIIGNGGEVPLLAERGRVVVQVLDLDVDGHRPGLGRIPAVHRNQMKLIAIERNEGNGITK